VAFLWKKLELWEPKSFIRINKHVSRGDIIILDSKHTCPVLQMEAPLLPSMAVGHADALVIPLASWCSRGSASLIEP
jgi:hypothetical protein